KGAQFCPRRFFNVDARLAPRLLVAMFDFAWIVHARAALRGWRRFQIARKLRHLLFEGGKRPERLHLEDGHETTVVMTATGFNAKATAGQEPEKDFHHGREAAALVTPGSAQREQRSPLAQARGIGGLSAIGVDHPSLWYRLPPRGSQCHLASRYRRSR